jgi:hypothetical protein
MAAKKKPMAKPTRTGAETKSYTNAQSRAKANQKSASAAHAGKSGKPKPYSQVARAKEDLMRQAGARARARRTSFGEAKNPPSVPGGITTFDRQETQRNLNKAAVLGKSPRAYDGKSSLMGQFGGTDRGGGVLGNIVHVGRSALFSPIMAVDRAMGGLDKPVKRNPSILGASEYMNRPASARGSRTTPVPEQNEERRNLAKKKGKK